MSDNVELLASNVVTVVRGFIVRHYETLAKHVRELDARVAAIPAGPKGEPGENGINGANGMDGKDGRDGVDGRSIAGETGAPGRDGRDGSNGKDGAQGERGADGLIGPRGERGIDGKDGSDGANGKDGTQGERGEQGLPGKDGAAGIDGKDGANGKDGAAGIDGKDGADAFTIAKQNGFVGSVNEWLFSLSGKDGISGADGHDGEDGSDGRNGHDGRDALEIDVIGRIDENRTYPGGTFAAFNGGTFRAMRATDPLVSATDPADAGWCCLWRGIDDVDEAMEDGGRFLVRTIKFCDGKSKVIRHKTAMSIYRGVYEAGRKYLAGDSITYDGSQWVALTDNDEKPRARAINAPQVWQLAAKRGAAGKALGA